MANERLFADRDAFVDRAVHREAAAARSRRCTPTLRARSAQQQDSGKGNEQFHGGG